MNSSISPSAAGRVDATPTPGAGRTGLQRDAGAVRLGIGRYTVDLVDAAGQPVALVGRGVGSAPIAAALPIGAVAVLLELADTADVRTAWRTAAWPLCVDATTAREAEG